MSSYAGIMVGNNAIFSYRNEIYPEISSLFRPEELKSVKIDPDSAPSWTGYYEYEEEVELTFYEVPGEVLAERLDVLGFGMVLAKEEFDRARRDTIEQKSEYLGDKHFQENRFDIQGEIDALKALTFEEWLKAVTEYVEDPEDNAVNPEGREDENGPLGLFDYLDERLVMRVICDVAPNKVVRLDVTELLAGGWLDAGDTDEQERLDNWLRKESGPIIITEGKRDAFVLTESIALLKPHLSPYVKFLDYDYKNEGSASAAISTIKSFASAGISNRVIVLLDNDSAAYDAERALASVSLPGHFRVLHYPELDLAKDYPTLGPQGKVNMDVNGLACSIEMYLGEDVLRNKGGDLMPVQWKGFMGGVKAYQGEVLNKTEVNKNFDVKLKAAKADPTKIAAQDWRGITAIIESLVSEFSRL